jgi:hypothetical protein
MDKEQILEQQKIKAARLKEKRELEERIVKAKIRKGGWQGFRLYIHGVFKEVYGRDFEEYWYHELIIRVLWNVIIGKENRVIIELAPRFAKTELTVRQFLSYCQGYHQFIKNQYFTYGAELTEDTSVDVKTIMKSDYFKEIFPKKKFSDDQNKKANWKLTDGTEFFGTSIGGAATGKGSHITVIDDSLKADDADSKAEKDNAWKFIKNSVFTRLESGGAVINIMQRLAEDDATGRFIKEQGVKNHIGGTGELESEDGLWTVITLPLISEHDIFYKYEDFEYFRESNEILPNRNYKTLEEITLLKRSVSKKEFEKQYNQNVTVAETGHFKKEDITYIADVDLPEQNLYIILDNAESTKDSADDRAIAVEGWSVDESGIELVVIMDGKRGKWEPYETVRQLIEMMIKFPDASVWIEEAGGGITIISIVKKELLVENTKRRAKGKPPIKNSINGFKPPREISKQAKIRDYMTAPHEQHQIKKYKGCDVDFSKQYDKELLRFDPSKKSQTDNCIDAVASGWLIATPKKTIEKVVKKIAKRKKPKKAGKWRGV